MPRPKHAMPCASFLAGLTAPPLASHGSLVASRSFALSRDRLLQCRGQG